MRHGECFPFVRDRLLLASLLPAHRRQQQHPRNITASPQPLHLSWAASWILFLGSSAIGERTHCFHIFTVIIHPFPPSTYHVSRRLPRRRNSRSWSERTMTSNMFCCHAPQDRDGATSPGPVPSRPLPNIADTIFAMASLPDDHPHALRLR